MPNKILFIFEGEVAEEKLWDIYRYHYPIGSPVILTVFANCIYDLWRTLSADSDLDIVEEIRSINGKNKEILKDVTRSDVSEVYLFFDYDCHDKKSNDEHLQDLITLFSDEYDKGMIFISYPMLESHRHCKKNEAAEFLLKTISRDDIKKYKQIVNNESHFTQMRKVSSDDMNWLTKLHLAKASVIKAGIRNQNPDEINIELLDQSIIHKSQCTFYKDVDNTVAILGAFPCFYYYYFGDKFLNMLDKTSPQLLNLDEKRNTILPSS